MDVEGGRAGRRLLLCPGTGAPSTFVLTCGMSCLVSYYCIVLFNHLAPSRPIALTGAALLTQAYASAFLAGKERDEAKKILMQQLERKQIAERVVEEQEALAVALCDTREQQQKV
jgi:hypothetical protein